MILTPTDPATLARALASIADALSIGARTALARITATGAERAVPALLERHRVEALRIAQEFGMGIQPGAPEDGFHWDGRALRAESEPYVLLHEVAHFQLAPAPRRSLPEFGLGPGPDTGRRPEAEAAQRLAGLPREAEESSASLLGILWEASLGHPALASFLDQNWLEGWQRGAAAAHFEAVYGRLLRAGLIEPGGTPTRRLAEAASGGSEEDVHGKTPLIGAGLPPAPESFEPA